jgi:hypothetical protein
MIECEFADRVPKCFLLKAQRPCEVGADKGSELILSSKNIS